MRTRAYISLLLSLALLPLASCDDDDACQGVSCGEHGTCDKDTGICVCQVGYTGAVCDGCATGYVEAAGECVAGECTENSHCDDGNVCNGEETCDANHECQAGAPVSCGAHQHCEEASGDCVCDDGWTLVGTDCVANLIASFDDLPLDAESYWSGDATGVHSFSSGDATFVNYYDPGMSYWEGFAYANTTDTTTADFTNQYSAITGGGHAGSQNYGVGYVGFMGTAPELRLTDTVAGYAVAGLYVTNTTYAYLSMRDGDAFSKKFGGPTGTDPDWFKLTIEGIDSTDATTGAVDFYLADYTSADASADYIIDDWTWVDLTSLGDVVGLRFSLSSTDMGPWGMNTPAYFAIDQVMRENPNP